MSRLKAEYFWVLSALTMLVIVVGAMAGLSLVNRFDDMSARREQQVISNGITNRVTEVAQMVLAQVVWDDAVRNLDNKFDKEWTRQNIGAYLHQSSGFHTSFVLDAKDRPIFAAHDGKPGDVDYAHYTADAAPLVASIRAMERSRRAVSGTSAAANLSAPIQLGALARVNGQIEVITASLVQPDFGSAHIAGSKAPIVIATMQINDAFLRGFARRYLLGGLRMVSDARAMPEDRAYIRLQNGRGQLVATLSWTPTRPGQEVLKTLGPPILAVMVVLAVATLVLLRRGRRMTEGLIASEARASHLAYYDALTGYPNRVLFFDRLGQALNQLRRNEGIVAVHAIDLDRFKEINDTFGHHAGDELIFQAAKRLAGTCRVTETFARLSGDEFAIVQTCADVAGAARLADRLIEAMQQPFDLGSGRVYAGCSIGVTIVTDSTLEPGETLRQADLALYRAKEAGKGQFAFFEDDMDTAVRLRRELEHDLREAISRNELSLAYQPQVSNKGVMTGVEALIRWNHPKRGPIAPSFFIPIAEQSGLIMQIGMFALRNAFEDGKRWRDIKIAVNVSATQLRLKTFVPEVKALVSETGINPAQYELEITEGILLGDDPETQQRLAELRAMGFSLALDDFGTGYSSLSYLQRYPIDKIKIDRSFINNLGVEDEANALVGAIVKLARALKLSVIAEGVETSDQLAHLSALGCSDVQGYLFSKPIDAGSIDTMYAQRHHAMQMIKTAA